MNATAPTPTPIAGRHSDCERKKPYPSEKAARNAVARLWKVKRKRKSGELDGMHAYPCPFCAEWHIGHAPGTKRYEPTLWELDAIDRRRRPTPTDQVAA